MDKASRGKYYLKGEEVSSYSEKQMAQIRNEMFGFVMQDFALIERETVEKNVVLPLLYSKRFRHQKRERVEQVLKEVGLYEKRQQLVTKLSGGQRQRVAIARALVNQPTILLADEPTGNLDPQNAWEIMMLLQEVNKMGTTVVVVTHNNDIVDVMQKRVVTLSEGTVVRDDKKGGYEYERD